MALRRRSAEVECKPARHEAALQTEHEAELRVRLTVTLLERETLMHAAGHAADVDAATHGVSISGARFRA